MEDYVLSYNEDGADCTLYVRCSARVAELMSAGLDKDSAVTNVVLSRIEQVHHSVDLSAR